MVRQLIKRTLINPFLAAGVLLSVAALFYYFFTQVDLQPQISSNFFFSKQSKIYKDNDLIFKKFLVSDAIILNLPTSDISSPTYLNRVQSLSERLKKIKGVQSVQSLTHGPDDLEAARKNPMWKRFLDTGSGKTSLIVCFIKPQQIESIVKKVKKLVRLKEYRGQTIHISGIPYIVEEIRRMLSHDMKLFMAGAVTVCSVVLLIIFLSFIVTLGAIITALSAAALTLSVQQWLGIPVGILTANLGAIVYVLTVSHIVFLTSNWRQDKHVGRKLRLASTITTTFPASFWAMVTTVFGFASLMFVEAQPLQQLGIGGTVGTLSAFLMAYGLFPIFLGLSRTGKKVDIPVRPRFFLPFRTSIGALLAVILIAVSGAVAWLGMEKVDTDPSLLAYFKKQQTIYKGIAAVDRGGGSNPLNFVISDRQGERLKNDKAYEKMQRLQKDLESHPAVGSVLSLPVLMAETQTHWLARLLPWGSVLSVLSRPQYGKIALGFITKDSKQALFMIRMKESGRSVERQRIVRSLMAKPRRHGLRLDIVGGSYYMQSQLAQKIRTSMRQGVVALVALFALIIFSLSLSLPITLFATLSIAATTGTFLGAVGWFGVPVDIISSPAINIILGLAVDGMIHIILAARRLSEARGHRTDADGWIMAIKSQGQGVLISGAVIASGFSVFYLSNFPPSQRFGLKIVFGTLVAMIMTLFVLPHLALLFRKKKKPSKESFLIAGQPSVPLDDLSGQI